MRARNYSLRSTLEQNPTMPGSGPELLCGRRLIARHKPTVSIAFQEEDPSYPCFSCQCVMVRMTGTLAGMQNAGTQSAPATASAILGGQRRKLGRTAKKFSHSYQLPRRRGRRRHAKWVPTVDEVRPSLKTHSILLILKA